MSITNRATKISISRDGVWAGDGTIDGDGEIVCSAVLGDTQDDSDATYDAIEEAIEDMGAGDEGSVTCPDGVYTFVLS